MDGHVNDHRTTAAPDDQSNVYRDLRRRNERRAKLARVRKAQRRHRIERVTEVVRQRKFYQDG